MKEKTNMEKYNSNNNKILLNKTRLELLNSLSSFSASELEKIWLTPEKVQTMKEMSYLSGYRLNSEFKLYGNNLNHSLDPFTNKNKSVKRFLHIQDFHEMYKIKHRENPIFLTITNNIHEESLEEQNKLLNGEWVKFRKSEAFKQNFIGYVKNVEATFTNTEYEGNLHYHILLWPRKGYFQKKNNYYITSEEGKNSLSKWFSGITKIQGVSGSNSGGFKEVSKYNVKTWDLTELLENGEKEKFIKVVQFFRNKRLHEFKIKDSLLNNLTNEMKIRRRIEWIDLFFNRVKLFTIDLCNSKILREELIFYDLNIGTNFIVFNE